MADRRFLLIVVAELSSTFSATTATSATVLPRRASPELRVAVVIGSLCQCVNVSSGRSDGNVEPELLIDCVELQYD